MKRIFAGIAQVIDTIMRWAGRILFLLLMVGLAFVLFSSPPERRVPDGAVMVWAPSGVVTEEVSLLPSANALLDSNVPVDSTMSALLRSLDRAAMDEQISGLVIDTRELLGITPAQLEDLGNALLSFKDSGKPMFAYGSYFSQAGYALASYADDITLHPMGNLMLTGFGGDQLYFRDLLDKLNVRVDIFRAGEYKSAGEPYVRMDMSEESRAASQALVDDLWASYRSRVANNRMITEQTVQGYADEFAVRLQNEANGNIARLAFEHDLVDNIAAADSFRRQVAAVSGVENGDFRQIHYGDYVAITDPLPSPVSDKVAVIVAEGTIMPGEDLTGIVGSESLIDRISRAQMDASVKAAVLRVNSPGGSALASEEIREALSLFRQSGKPLVVSMSGTAASGGYWIATAADQILASPSTVTGSIGVIGVVPSLEGAMDALGIGLDGVSTTELSRAGNVLRAPDENMQMIYQATIDDTYQRFMQLVANARGMTVAEVDAIGQGRVWSGEQALELGLVDALGNQQQAVDAAANLAGLSDYEAVYVQPEFGLLDQMLLQLLSTDGRMAFSPATTQWLGARFIERFASPIWSSLLPIAQRTGLTDQLNWLLSPVQGAGQMQRMAYCDSCMLFR
ncbi:signal peptide peptidase SppA [Pseudohongiella nitratireducens]|uniref:signal peptide peptidase SppA n=1 Tax=Pseudohongiella nitratireducens TaxID=1768907 RepID=UPI0030ED4E43